MNYGLMSEIDPTNDQTWCDRLFLTIDQEWVADEILFVLLDTILCSGGKATVYCTYDGPLIRELGSDERVDWACIPL
jgi:hypothetical protein